jgi:hypothetical protein
VLGALVGLVGNLLHPATSGPADPAATARVVAESQIWIPVHLALVVAFELMLGGLVGIHDSITGGLPVRSRGSDWPRRPLAPRSRRARLARRFAAKHLADAWLAAPEEARAAALGVSGRWIPSTSH